MSLGSLKPRDQMTDRCRNTAVNRDPLTVLWLDQQETLPKNISTTDISESILLLPVPIILVDRMEYSTVTSLTEGIK